MTLFTLAAFAGSVWYYADLFAHFRVQLLCAAVMAALVFGWQRRWIGAITGIGVALLNVAAMASHFKADPALYVAADAGQTLRCISFNVLQGNQEIDRLERFIRDSQADVILLQEVSPKHARALQLMKEAYPNQLVLGKKNSKGVALLTRLPSRELSFQPFEDGEIGAITGEVRVGSNWVTIFGIHSHKPTSASGAATQRRYFRWAAEKSNRAAESGPVILMGDFNSTPWSSAFKAFAASSDLLDTSRGSIFSATWRVASPQRILIDHGFVSRGIVLRARDVGKDVGSDHRPLILDFLIPRLTSSQLTLRRGRLLERVLPSNGDGATP